MVIDSFPCAHMSKKRLIVVGDRVLVKPEEGEQRSKVGLYLPATRLTARRCRAGGS
jgi:chaperonin GroES